jgi:brefeldin A-inhibited guanine nucleotide-exchange protein
LQSVRSTFHVYLVGKTPVGKELARKTLVDMLKCVFNRMEAYDIINQDGAAINPISQRNGEDETTVATAITAVTCGSPSTTSKDRTPSSPTENGMMEDQSGAIGMFASQYHTDSYLLFRALCKLSSKTLPGDENVGMSTTGGPGLTSSAGANFFSNSQVVDPLALNSKVLSLELILAVFEHCGDAFRNGEKFIYAVQSYLCVSLLKNCMSNQTAVAHLSLKIFLLLVRVACF